MLGLNRFTSDGISSALKKLDIKKNNPGAYGSSPNVDDSANKLESHSPINNKLISEVSICSSEDYESVVKESIETFYEWRKVPAPKRGDLIRKISNALRENKTELAKIITVEMGKTLEEAAGEVQEVIDIADYAVGLSRQLCGKTMHSERDDHRMYEQWHPLGVIGVITAFNFPQAVWGWNAMLAAVCGNVVLWKPSELTPISAIAINNLARKIASEEGFPGLFNLVISDSKELGQMISSDRRIALVSATGSCQMGRSVAQAVGKRLGKSLLELGGNNAVIVLDDADLDLVVPAVTFGAVGTSGQRCTTTRRLYVHNEIEEVLTKRLIHAYKQVSIGNPLKKENLLGPLVSEDSVKIFKSAIEEIKKQGGDILYGGKVIEGMPSNLYVEPTIVRAKADMPIVQEETFAPILYIMSIDNLGEGICLNNSVPQGLSSSIFTNSLKKAEEFLSVNGSDCGIANVNIGTSGAEIGGAFGGEKDTGGGRESGSDSWKQYMRRQTNTINYSNSMPLAQGINFNIEKD
ncbi:UNVERIFIED_CONTAM: hypothetical protein GTU68_053378 [Idotea baltica]|nr:hypothetical protein [Idotea baltica]